jgi:hypothetical protein
MDKAKLKKIEAKLFQLLAQFDQGSDQKATAPKKAGNVRVIRRRKGNPDVHISRKAGELC